MGTSDGREFVASSSKARENAELRCPTRRPSRRAAMRRRPFGWRRAATKVLLASRSGAGRHGHVCTHAAGVELCAPSGPRRARTARRSLCPGPRHAPPGPGRAASCGGGGGRRRHHGGARRHFAAAGAEGVGGVGKGWTLGEGGSRGSATKNAGPGRGQTPVQQLCHFVPPDYGQRNSDADARHHQAGHNRSQRRRRHGSAQPGRVSLLGCVLVRDTIRARTHASAHTCARSLARTHARTHMRSHRHRTTLVRSYT